MFLEPDLDEDRVQLGVPQISGTRMSIKGSEELGHRALELQPAGGPPGLGELHVGVDAVGGVHEGLDVGANAVGLQRVGAGREGGAGQGDSRSGHRARDGSDIIEDRPIARNRFDGVPSEDHASLPAM